MINNLYETLSDHLKGRKRSAIRELLKLTQKPEIISFAGGLPSPESFPIEELKEITNEVLENEGALALQYGTTEGDSLLKEMLIKHYKHYGVELSQENILITTASQQGLDLVSRIFLNPKDKVISGLPSYLGGLSAFTSYGAQIIGIPLDDNGIRTDKLEETLKELEKKGEKPKFIYIVPDFQNPAGITIPENRRKEIIQIAKKYDVLILEDSPYRELRFEGEHQKTIYSLDKTGQVILLGTFSKIFLPGFRIGWAIAHEDIIDKMVIAKQSVDLCTSTFNQRIAARFIEKGYLGENIKRIIKMYREKRDGILEALEKYMPKGVTWTKPQGGLFLFLYFPEYIDAEDILHKAIEKNVAFVAGTHFYCNGEGHNTARINFSFSSKEDNHEGIKRLAEVIKEEMKIKS